MGRATTRLCLVSLALTAVLILWATNMKTVFSSASIFAISLLSSPSLYGKGLAYSTLLRQDRNNGIHLAVSPVCGPLSGNVSDVNTGIDLSTVKTIVAFGVSLRPRTAHLDEEIPPTDVTCMWPIGLLHRRRKRRWRPARTACRDTPGSTCWWAVYRWQGLGREYRRRHRCDAHGLRRKYNMWVVNAERI